MDVAIDQFADATSIALFTITVPILVVGYTEGCRIQRLTRA